ncbi:MAG: hypothetical protein V4640_06995 [Verrucomicrobiota bacterium]
MIAANPSSVVKLTTGEPPIDIDVARMVGQEILENRLDPATWATALSSNGGKRQEALAAYARLRMQQVGSRRRSVQNRAESFNFRRVTQCFGVKTVQDLLQRSHPGKQLNFLRPRLSVLSLMTLGIGAAGSAGSIGRLLGEHLPYRVTSVLPLLAILCGLAAVISVVMLRFILPRRWVMIGWNAGLMAVCVLACAGSLLCGVKLIAHAPPMEFKKTPVKSATAANKPVLVKPNIALEDMAVSAIAK